MEGFSDELAESVFNNGLTDRELILLTTEEIKELAPRIKDRVDLREYIKKLKVWHIVNYGTCLQMTTDYIFIG